VVNTHSQWKASSRVYNLPQIKEESMLEVRGTHDRRKLVSKPEEDA
jgi:hypothetical protein